MPINRQITITNRLAGLNNSNTNLASPADNFFLMFANAPAGWTVSPARTGAINAGASSTISITIDPHGVAAAGIHNFELVISSGILRDVGTRLALSVTVA
jgi:hypothetical protein